MIVDASGPQIKIDTRTREGEDAWSIRDSAFGTQRMLGVQRSKYQTCPCRPAHVACMFSIM